MTRIPSLPITTLLLLGGVTSACGDADRSQAAALDSATRGKVVGLQGPCQEGELQQCSLTLGEHEGTISCYEGTRTCHLGLWGSCTDGREFSFKRTKTPLGSINFKAFNDPRECTDNPCNAYCREFIEQPPEGIVADEDPAGVVEVQVLVGDLADYSDTLVALGNTETCQDANDCQFNSSCTDPGIGSCNHSVCSTGDALNPNCNRCVTTVCATDPECCGPVIDCSHDPCQTGNALDPSCDTCAEAVCAAHPECCDSGSAEQWNATCVGYIDTECSPLGQTCGCPSNGVELDGICYAPHDVAMEWAVAASGSIGCPSVGIGWQLAEPKTAEINAVVQQLAATVTGGVSWIGARDVSGDPATPNEWVWNSDSVNDPFYVGDENGSLQLGYDFESWAEGKPELSTPLDAATIDASGLWNHDSRSNGDYSSVCSGVGNTLNPPSSSIAWRDSCVQLAKSECGVQCSDQNALGLGACVPQVRSSLDVECPGFDLAVGATCDEGGTAQIPICNHGQSVAPAGLEIQYFSGSALVGQLEPDAGLAQFCDLSEAIPPGRCVIVTGCANIQVGDAIVVHPRTGATDTSECRFEDNWSLYNNAACTAPLCEASTQSASQVAQLGCTVPIENPLNVATDLTTVTLATGIAEPDCGENEVMWGSSCYFFSSNAENWDNARADCQDRGTGWDLIAINSPQENAFAREGFGGGFFFEFQIGFNDLANEGVHEWSNGSCTAYENWSLDDGPIFTGKGKQPNDLPAGANGCARMFIDNAWGDTSCAPASFQYVCEGPVIDAEGGCDKEQGHVTGPDGDCYVVNEQLLSQPDSEAACQAIGVGWGLAHIRSHEVNEFALSFKGCEPVWLNRLSDNFSAQFAQIEIIPGAADFSDDPSIDAVGIWQLTKLGNGEEKFALCQGPSVSIGTPPLEQVANATGCSSSSTRQYYFNGDFFGGTEPINFTPENLQLCPSTCNSAKLEPAKTRLDIAIPCAPPTPPSLFTTHSIFYETDCREGGSQWDFLYYDAITPGDSRIDFSVRAGTDEATIVSENAAFVSVASAHAVPDDTQRCEIDPPNCPIDLFNLLGNPGFQREALELRIEMIPGTNGEGPLLRDWKVRFSCPPGE